MQVTPDKILLLESSDYSQRAIDIYRKIGSVFDDPNLIQADQVTILVVRLGFMLNRCFLKEYEKLKYIVSPTTGLNHIDTVYCKERGIEVISLTECKERLQEVTSTSELTLGLIIGLLRGITASCNSVRDGVWDRDQYKSRQLSDMTIGIIGLGRIGTHLAKYCSALDMTVIASDPYRSEKYFSKRGAKKVNLQELISTSDIVSINCNLNSETEQLIGWAEIKLLKPGCLLVNTARGEIVNEDAIEKGIREGILAGIAVDVITDEHKNGLMNSKIVSLMREGFNVIVTPHIGGCTSDAMKKTEEIAAERLEERVQIYNRRDLQ